MSRFSYREPAWLILAVGVGIGLVVGFGLGRLSKTTTATTVPHYSDPDPARPETMWRIGKKAAEESKREREAAGDR